MLNHSSAIKYAAVVRDNIRDNLLLNGVEKGSLISTFEGAFPALFNDFQLMYYPAGLNKVEYLLLQRGMQESNANITKSERIHRSYTGAISYHGQEDLSKMNYCLIQKAASLGFDTLNPIDLGYGYWLIKKLNN